MTGQAGREDRLNFGGIHKAGAYHEQTGLALMLTEFAADTGKSRDATVGMALMTREGGRSGGEEAGGKKRRSGITPR